MEAVQGVLGEISRCVAQQNGRALAALLSAVEGRPLAPQVQGFCAGAEREARVEEAAYDIVGERWGPIAAKQVLANYKCSVAIGNRRYAPLMSALARCGCSPSSAATNWHK